MQALGKAITALALWACGTAYAAGTRVVIDRGDYTGPLEVRIGVPQEDGEPRWIAAKRLRTESSADFGPLAAGTYIVLLSGDRPFERFAVRFGLRGEGDEVLPIAVPRPLSVTGSIRLGAVPAGDAVLSFRNREFGWSTNFSARPDGTFEAQLWQPGEFVLTARGGALTSLVRRPVRIAGPAVAVDLSPLRITGVVSDEEGRPVAEAQVALRKEFGRDITTSRVHTDGHGMFEFVDLEPGPYSIGVIADGYLAGDSQPVYVTGETAAERVGITLSAGLPRALRIVDAAGRPVPNAAVSVFSDARLRSTTTTDVEGRATVSLPSSGTAAAWVIAPSGSFAVMRLDPGGRTAGAAKLVVPDGTASITIDVLTSDRAGVPGVKLLMRYNGEVLAPGAFTLRTDEKGRASLTNVPPGLYEFWPYSTAEEAAELISAQAFSPGPAPIAIEAGQGQSRATVMVEKKEPKRGVAQ